MNWIDTSQNKSNVVHKYMKKALNTFSHQGKANQNYIENGYLQEYKNNKFLG